MENLKEDIVAKIFRAIGKGLRPTVLKTLSKKDPKFSQLVKNLEKSKKDLADILDKQG